MPSEPETALAGFLAAGCIAKPVNDPIRIIILFTSECRDRRMVHDVSISIPYLNVCDVDHEKRRKACFFVPEHVKPKDFDPQQLCRFLAAVFPSRRNTSGISRMKRFCPTQSLGSRAGFEATIQKWFQKLHSDPRSRRGKTV
jgi:hypothetical protein